MGKRSEDAYRRLVIKASPRIDIWLADDGGQDSAYSQAEIQAGPSCPRPKVKLAPAYTAKQGQYLAFIYYYTKIHGEPPSEAEMQHYFRVTPPSVHQMVLGLECKGLIARMPRQRRSIRLLIDRADLPDLE